jgi:sugar-specific transcriptional regulator TrmB
MTAIVAIKKHLEKFGLSKNEAEIYILLLRRGNLRISEIVSTLQLPRSSVYENLKYLLRLGLVEEVIENSYKVIRAYPIGSIKHHLDEQVQALQEQAVQLDFLENAIGALPAIQIQKSVVVRYYKGQAGARQLFWNTLKATGTVYVQSEWGRGRYVGVEFYKKFVAESYARNFSEQVIINDTPRVLNSIREHIHSPLSRTDVLSIRCINQEQITFKGETLIYDNIYAQIFLKDDEISGFEIESQQFVDTQRAIFAMLWEAAEPVSKKLD